MKFPKLPLPSSSKHSNPGQRSRPDAFEGRDYHNERDTKIGWKMARARGLDPLTLRSKARFPYSNSKGLQSNSLISQNHHSFRATQEANILSFIFLIISAVWFSARWMNCIIISMDLWTNISAISWRGTPFMARFFATECRRSRQRKSSITVFTNTFLNGQRKS